jgi:hypothetical protein
MFGKYLGVGVVDLFFCLQGFLLGLHESPDALGLVYIPISVLVSLSLSLVFLSLLILLSLLVHFLVLVLLSFLVHRLHVSLLGLLLALLLGGAFQFLCSSGFLLLLLFLLMLGVMRGRGRLGGPEERRAAYRRG